MMAQENQTSFIYARHKSSLLILLLLLVGIGFSYLQISKQSEELLVQDAIEDASLLAKSLETFRKYYSDNVISRALEAGMEIRHDFRDSKDSLPLPFTLHNELSKQIGKEHFGTVTRIFSEYPYPWNRDGGVKDQFESDALAALTKNPDKPFTLVEGVDDDRILRFAKADLMHSSCIGCHNSSPDSPKRDWKVGDVAGVLTISVPLTAQHQMLHGKMGAGYILVGFLLILLVVALYIANVISHSSILGLEREVKGKIVKLEKTERSLAAAQKVGRVGNWVLDTDSQRLWASQGLLDLLGIGEEEFDGTMGSLLKHLHKDDRELFRKCVDRALQGEEEVSEDYRIIRPDGELRYLHETARVVEEENNSKRLVGVVQDVTGKRNREAKLTMLSEALEQAVEAVLITDRSNNILYVNSAFTEITGYALEEVIGRNPNILSSGRHGQEFYQRLWDDLRSRGFWKGVVWNKRKNGDIFPEQIHIKAIVNQQGRVVNYTAVFSDISEQLELEGKLRQAQKMEAIGILVGGIAHDFNNILAAITGNLYLVKKDLEDRPEVKEKIIRVERESFRAAEMIAQLLTFARKDLIQMVNVSLSDLYRSTHNLVRVAIREDITLNWNPCTSELCINGDENQLKQILLNLVNNARDAVDGVEKPEISVSLKEYEPDRPFREKYPHACAELYACLEVSDNGCGISQDALQHVFEPFYTTKEVGKGTGLGLSMIFGSVQNHDGVIDVESQVGRGSRFCVYLPSLACEKIASIEEKSLEDVVMGNEETILVVDDEDMVRSVARDLLNSLNYIVLEACDGVSAVEVFKANQTNIRLVILDVVMPQMGGVQAAEMIRAISPDMPIMFATGYDQGSVLEGINDWASIAVLSKPYRAKKISMEIQKLLG